MITATFGTVDERSLAQLESSLAPEEGALGALMADHHLGYAMPIGGVAAYRSHVSPSGVGYDIACGNKAVKTTLRASDVHDWEGVVSEVARRVSFGMGRKTKEPMDHPVLDEIASAELSYQRDLVQLARDQLGTVGAGNHYVDLLEDQDGWVWIGIHFGSRGFGHKTTTYFKQLAGVRNDSMNAPPLLFDAKSLVGEEYVRAMELAGRYAYAGRDVVCDVVLDILRVGVQDEVHNHHNFAWHESHFGELWWVVRKGATPAFPGQRGFVGGSMGGPSAIIRGVDGELSEQALYSTVHGAGRRMSRTEAAGKVKRGRSMMGCTVRDCNYALPTKQWEHEGRPACGQHPDRKLRKYRTEDVRTAPGRVDWPAVRERLHRQGVTLIGGAADEAPEVYKDLTAVIAAHYSTIEVTHWLEPLGVVMASPDVRDDFRD